MTQIKTSQMAKFIEYSVYSHCKSLKKIIIPSSVIEIGTFDFSSCIGLKELVISPIVIKIE